MLPAEGTEPLEKPGRGAQHYGRAQPAAGRHREIFGVCTSQRVAAKGSYPSVMGKPLCTPTWAGNVDPL